MRSRLKCLVLSLLAAILVLQAAPVGAQRRANASAPTAALNRLFDEEWEWTMREFPTFASSLGDRRYTAPLPDASLAASERRQQHRQQTLARLLKLDRARLSTADQLNYDLFRKDLENDIEEYRLHLHLMPVSQRGGVQSTDELAELLRFQTVKDYDDWLARLRAFPAYVDQTLEVLREGVRTKMLWPKVTLQRVPAQLDRQLKATTEASGFYKPFRNFPPDIPESERARLTQQGREAVERSVMPALKKFRD